MKNAIQYGAKELDYTNGTGVEIASGAIVPIDSSKSIIAIAEDTIANGAKGVLKRDVIVNVPKVAGGAIAVGAQFKIGTAGNTVQTASAGATVVRNAWAYKAAGSADTTADIVVD